jgi:DNA repair photolyase
MHQKPVKGILSANNGMNLFRGCTHGCIYCDSRSDCYHMDHAFEDVLVKSNALELLEQTLMRKRKKCMIQTESMSDPYIPEELELRHTRKALAIIDRFGFGLALQTKSDRILRDLDLLKSIHAKAKCVVELTLTTIDDDLSKIIEPNVATTSRRIEVLEIMKKEGIPTIVWLCPLLPWINDTEENVRSILDACIKNDVKGIIWFGAGLTLRDGNREYFYKKLDQHFPKLRARYESTYGTRYEIRSEHHAILDRMVKDTCRVHGIPHDPNDVFSYMHEFPYNHKIHRLSIDDFI